MKILLTGGNGDLGQVLSAQLIERGDRVFSFDIQAPKGSSYKTHIAGSVLNRPQLAAAIRDIDVVVHIAAWHGFHEFTQEKDVYDFWDLNVTGTFNVFQAMVDHHIKNIVYISSECAANQYGIYGHTKVLGETIAETYQHRHKINVISLRAGAFIPYWNQRVYPQNAFVEWAKWFCKGAVHINDMSQAVIKSIDLLNTQQLDQHYILDIDGAYEYTKEDLLNWDSKGPGTTFKKYYQDYVDLLEKQQLDLSQKPNVRDISAAKRLLGYQPQYSLKTLLDELLHHTLSTTP